MLFVAASLATLGSPVRMCLINLNLMFIFIRSSITALAVILLVDLLDAPVKAAVIINASESGGSVIFNYSGTINISSLQYLGDNVNAGGPWVAPSAGLFWQLAKPGVIPDHLVCPRSEMEVLLPMAF